MLSYLIEVKRGRIKPENHLGIFSTYFLFFPKISQGPIERPENLLPQFYKDHKLTYGKISEGVKILLWGFFKKLVVADRLAIYVNAVYNNPEDHNGTTLAIATIFYSFQIYADFSGYTDIAIGSAKLLGFNLTNNFHRPYFSNSIKQFWSRWHITLSTWLRDYLFLPLAFVLSRRLKKEKYLRLSSDKWIYLITTLITFAICGLWHGEGLNFLIWGLIFGIYLVTANIFAKPLKKIRKKMGIHKPSFYYQFFNIIITFLLVSFTWIFFRTPDTTIALSIIKKIISLDGSLFINQASTMFYSLLAILLLVSFEFKAEFMAGRYHLFENRNWVLKYLSYTSLLLVIGLFGVLDGSQFIYFKF